MIIGGIIAVTHAPATNVATSSAAATGRKCRATIINTATAHALNGAANGKHTITAILAIIDSATSRPLADTSQTRKLRRL